MVLFIHNQNVYLDIAGWHFNAEISAKNSTSDVCSGIQTKNRESNQMVTVRILSNDDSKQNLMIPKTGQIIMSKPLCSSLFEIHVND